MGAEGDVVRPLPVCLFDERLSQIKNGISVVLGHPDPELDQARVSADLSEFSDALSGGGRHW